MDFDMRRPSTITLLQPNYGDSDSDDEEEDSVGCNISTKLVLPACCIVMDKVRNDLNMMNDGFTGGVKFLTKKVT